MGKRTYEQSLTFFNTRYTDDRGLGRELYKTPIPIIKQIVESIIVKYPELYNKIWVDPCAGDGRWSKVINSYGIKTKSFDIEPLSEDVIKQDFYEYKGEDNIFIIGNPPFSELKRFIEHSLSICPECYFLGGSGIITGGLSNKVKLLHRFVGYEGNQKDKRSKVKFIDSNDKDVIVWCCGAIFDNLEHNKFKRTDTFEENTFRVAVKKYCKEDNRIVKLEK